jgi:hypothetical protein
MIIWVSIRVGQRLLKILIILSDLIQVRFFFCGVDDRGKYQVMVSGLAHWLTRTTDSTHLARY